MSSSVVSRLRELFVGRDDVYGEQWINAESGESGYIKVVSKLCSNVPPCSDFRCNHRKNLQLTDSDISSHVAGRRTLGIYQLDENDHVKWLCLDIDKDKSSALDLTPEELQSNSQEQVRKIINKALSCGLKPVVEDSGNRGYHIWLFFEDPIAANKVQAVGHHLISGLQVMQGLHIEVFPKQTATKSLGNLVKLPLGVHLKSKRRSMFVNKNFEPFADQFKFLTTIPRHDKKSIDAIIDWYNLKPTDNIRRMSDIPLVGQRVPLCLSRIMSNGIGDGMRDMATFKLSCYLRDRGFPEDLAQLLMYEWNQRNSPPLSGSTLAKKVESAYRDSYGFLPCFEPAFDKYCDSNCGFFPMKRERREA